MPLSEMSYVHAKKGKHCTCIFPVQRTQGEKNVIWPRETCKSHLLPLSSFRPQPWVLVDLGKQEVGLEGEWEGPGPRTQLCSNTMEEAFQRFQFLLETRMRPPHATRIAFNLFTPLNENSPLTGFLLLVSTVFTHIKSVIPHLVPVRYTFYLHFLGENLNLEQPAKRYTL